MERQRSLLILIAVPAVVALAVTLIVLTLWDRQQDPEYIMLPTHSGTALVPPRDTQPPTDPAAGDDDDSADDNPEVVLDTEDVVEPTIAPGCENPVHAVASGETLGIIAQQYDVTIEDIVTLNQILDPDFNPNFLSVSQEVVIPECGIPTVTPTATPTSTAVPTRNVPTPISTATEPPPGVITVEVARVLNPGDITNEAVEIINRGSSVARLEDWTLVNERTGTSFEFPTLNLFPQGAVTVYTGVGENTAIDLYWGLDEAVWLDGDTVSLYDARGELVNEYTIPAE